LGICNGADPEVSTYMVPSDSWRLARVTVGLDELTRGAGSSARDTVAEASPHTHVVVYLNRAATREGHHLLDRGGVAPRVLVGVQHDVVHLRQSIPMFGSNNTSLRYITPCSLLKFNRRFGETYHLHLQGRRISRARNQRESRWQAGHLARLILPPWRWRRYVLPKRRLIFNRLQGVISQKMVLFITTAVRTSNPTPLC
jgi:hypothetical protein